MSYCETAIISYFKGGYYGKKGHYSDEREGTEQGGEQSVYIDDATGRVFARFYPYEGTIPAMDSFKRYIKAYGIPVSVN